MFRVFRHEKRGSVTAAAAGFAAFVNIYALQTLLPLLSEQFQASSRQVSLAVSATTLAVALASPLAGWLVGRLSRGTLTKLSVGGLVFCGLMVALATSLQALILWRFGQGLFLPLLIAGVLSFLAEDFEPGQLGRATSNYVTWTIVGGFSGRWLAGFVAAHWGLKPALIALALANAAAGTLLLLSLKDPNKSLAGRSSPSLACFLATLERPELRAGYLIGFGSLFTMVGLFTYVTFHLAERFLLGPEALGRTFAVYLLGIAITPYVGTLLQSWGYSKTVRHTAKLAIAGLSLTLIPHLGAVLLGLALVCVAGFATQACVSSFMATLEPQTNPAACGLYLSAYYCGGWVGAALPGFAWEAGGWPACVLLLLAIQAMVGLKSSRLA